MRHCRSGGLPGVDPAETLRFGVGALRAVGIALAILALSSGARAQSAVLGGGAGVAKANDANEVGRSQQPNPDFGFVARGFAFYLGDAGTLGAGMTGLHVVAPRADRTSTLTFVGVSGAAGSGFESELGVFLWLSFGFAGSNGTCGSGVGGELGLRGDMRATRGFRLGTSISLTGASTGCSSISDEDPSSHRSSLGSAIALTLDASFSL